MRKGLSADFDPSKMLAGEWAVTIDADTQHQIVYMCFAAGIVKRMGTLEDLEDWLRVAMIPYTDSFDLIRTECIDLRDEMIIIRDSLIPAAEIALQIPALVQETKEYKEFVENAVDLNIPTMYLDTYTGLLSYDGGKVDFDLDGAGNLCWELI